MGNILTRIQAIATNEGITIGALERKIGASKGVLSRAIANGTDIQSKWIQILVENYPHYSVEWLITGNGEMLTTNANEADTTEQSIPTATPSHSATEGIPLIPEAAMAGAFTSELNVMEYECDRYVVPAFKGADFLITVKGTSMYPKYNSGDLVACKKVPMTDLFFQWNNVYVIDTNQGPLIKRIQQGHDSDHITLVSDNPSYPPFELSLSSIHAVAIVMGVIRLE